MGIGRALAVAVTLCVLMVGHSVGAQPPAPAVHEARELADRGYVLFQQGDYAEAVALFQQAERLSHSPVIGSFIAQSFEAMGALVEAQHQYARIINEQLDATASEDFREAQRRARRQLPLLIRRIPHLQLRVAGVPEDELEIELDGRPWHIGQLDRRVPINPGRHRLAVRAPRREPLFRTFKASERQVSEIDLMFAAPPAALPEDQSRDLSWLPPSVSFAVGGSALTVSVVTAAVYFSRAAALKDRCPDNRCPEELETERDSISMLGTVSLVSFGLGMVGVSAGTALVLLREDDEPGDREEAGPTLAVRLSPLGLGIEGRF